MGILATLQTGYMPTSALMTIMISFDLNAFPDFPGFFIQYFASISFISFRFLGRVSFCFCVCDA
jgi:hypothetical protein